MSACTVPDCGGSVNARGLCRTHYSRWVKHGDPQAHIPVMRKVSSTAPCSDCLRTLPADAFDSNRSRCKACRAAIAKRQYLAKRTPCVDCGMLGAPESERCHACSGIARRVPPSPTRQMVDGNGYVRLLGYFEHPNAFSRKKGQIFEHTKVMSEMLGRYLRPGENVHHKNGVRDDNRPENLELWVISQPAGQRAADLVEWAYEILRRYESEVAA